MMIRPNLIGPISIDIVDLWAYISVHLVLYGIFLIVSWVINVKASKKIEVPETLAFCLSMVLGLIILLIYGVTLTTVKGMMLTLLLLYASISDLETRKVPDCVTMMIFILSFVGFSTDDLLSMIIGAVIVFIPQFTLAIIKPSRAFGGADLKISTALAFLLGAEKGTFVLIVGMLLAVIFMAIYNRVNAKDQKEAFPLVPFLSVGAMLAYLI